MPCDCYGAEDMTIRQLREELQRVTAMLCEMCQMTQSDHRVMPTHVYDWWIKHIEADREQERLRIARRQEAEALLAQLAKLGFEVKLTGVKDDAG